MAWDDTPKIRGYSLTDFHDFEECRFRFYVRHDLDKKYEIGKGGVQMALGVLLDKSIKNIHKYNAYNHPVERIVKVVRFSAEEIRKEEANGKRPNFNTATVAFLTDEVIQTAEQILKNYYNQIQGKFKTKVLDIGFYQKSFEIDGENFKVWGGPDTLEMGGDGMVEVIDYKSRQDISKGKKYMDMDLMPKLYTLLLAEKLLELGYKKARFVVKFWQDPLDESFAEEFDLENLGEVEKLFKGKIKEINANKEVTFCRQQFCDGCNAEKREDYKKELEKLGFSVEDKNIKIMTGEEFLNNEI